MLNFTKIRQVYLDLCLGAQAPAVILFSYEDVDDVTSLVGYPPRKMMEAVIGFSHNVPSGHVAMTDLQGQLTCHEAVLLPNTKLGALCIWLSK